MKIVKGWMARLSPGSLDAYDEMVGEDKPDALDVGGGPYRALVLIKGGDRIFRNTTVRGAYVVQRDADTYQVMVELLGCDYATESAAEDAIAAAVHNILAGRVVYDAWSAKFEHYRPGGGDRLLIRSWKDQGGRTTPLSQATWRDSATYREREVLGVSSDRSGYVCTISIRAPRLPALFAEGGDLGEWPSRPWWDGA